MRFSVIIAEVLDKEPGLAAIWLSHVILAGLGYLLCRRDWRWLFAVVPMSTYAVWFGAVDLWDTSVGPAILQESRPFFVQWHIAMALVVAAPLVGFWSGLRRRMRCGPSRVVSSRNRSLPMFRGTTR
jgi:hypothetical protein